jgi:hypothetical protein
MKLLVDMNLSPDWVPLLVSFDTQCNSVEIRPQPARRA